MKVGDKQLGKPQILYKDTKANIEALSGVVEGGAAYATDTNRLGSYDGSSWIWAREVLTADRTYYVRTDGSDSNTGLVDSAGGAFLTIQKAVNVATELDLNGKILTIQVGDGTYTGAVTLKNLVGFSGVGYAVIQGNSYTPSNVVISTTSSSGFIADGVNTAWFVKDLKVQTTTAGACIDISNSQIALSNIIFGASASSHMRAQSSATIIMNGNYSISGGATYHYDIGIGSVLSCFGRTVTFTASVGFTIFAVCAYGSTIMGHANTYSLGGYTITGQRYYVVMNGACFVNGGGANYFPGSTPGSASTGGQYA